MVSGIGKGKDGGGSGQRRMGANKRGRRKMKTEEKDLNGSTDREGIDGQSRRRVFFTVL